MSGGREYQLENVEEAMNGGCESDRGTETVNHGVRRQETMASNGQVLAAGVWELELFLAFAKCYGVAERSRG